MARQAALASSRLPTQSLLQPSRRRPVAISSASRSVSSTISSLTRADQSSWSTAHATAAEGVHTGQLHCHYCLAVNPLPATCPTCGKKLTLFGLGTQRVEEELTAKFPGLNLARVYSDTMRGGRSQTPEKMRPYRPSKTSPSGGDQFLTQASPAIVKSRNEQFSTRAFPRIRDSP